MAEGLRERETLAPLASRPTTRSPSTPPPPRLLPPPQLRSAFVSSKTARFPGPCSAQRTEAGKSPADPLALAPAVLGGWPNRQPGALPGNAPQGPRGQPPPPPASGPAPQLHGSPPPPFSSWTGPRNGPSPPARPRLMGPLPRRSSQAALASDIFSLPEREPLIFFYIYPDGTYIEGFPAAGPGWPPASTQSRETDTRQTKQGIRAKIDPREGLARTGSNRRLTCPWPASAATEARLTPGRSPRKSHPRLRESRGGKEPAPQVCPRATEEGMPLGVSGGAGGGAKGQSAPSLRGNSRPPLRLRDFHLPPAKFPFLFFPGLSISAGLRPPSSLSLPLPSGEMRLCSVLAASSFFPPAILWPRFSRPPSRHLPEAPSGTRPSPPPAAPWPTW